MWSSDEDKIILEHYKDNIGIKNFNHFKYLSELLNKNGYSRTNSSVSRRFHRLGLKYYSTTQKEIKGFCSDCGIEIIIFSRYANSQKNKMSRCSKCQDYKNREYDRINLNRMKIYHSEYCKNWNKKRLISQKHKQIS